jgi:RimK-like ATP-grasp domain
MIVLCGIPSESPLAMVAAALTAREAKFIVVNQREVARNRLRVRLEDSRTDGELVGGGTTVPLEAVTGLYLRLMDDSRLPEVVDEPPDSESRRRARTFHELLAQWAEVTPATVINRYSHMGSNFSKPYQSQLIAGLGFRVPDTLVSNDPEAVLTFREHHRQVIYKSVSSERSIVRMLTDSDLSRLERIEHCPVQFQEYVPGEDIRVHTIGDRVFATAIASSSTDYRYAASRTGSSPTLTATDVPDDIADRCIRLAASLGLEFAGIDLRCDEHGRYFCFEINPSPGFSYYESHTGQPIAQAVAAHLHRGRSGVPSPGRSLTRDPAAVGV